MDRFRTKFLSQVQILQDRLEGLLEKDWGPQKAAGEKSVFEVQTDLQGLETLGWSLPLTEPDRSQVLFDRLAPYFETGFCFHSVAGSVELSASQWKRWRLESAFHLSQILPLLPEDREKQVSLPSMSLTEVRRVNPTFLLRELQLPTEITSPDTSALVIRPSDQRLWVVFSRLDDLFLKPHLSQIHERCLILLADFFDEESETSR
jgi:hypothetical protein